MNHAHTTVVPPDQPVAHGNTYTVVPSASDETAGRLALVQLLERLDTRQRIDSALREYEWRLANSVPYEDVVSAEEFRRRYGV